MASIFGKDKDVKEAPKAGAKTVDETVPTQSIPYPTGNPPDPMEAYNAANPERSVEWTTGVAPPPEGGTQSKKGK